MDKKIRAISVALNRLVLRTDFNPDYLIFSRFYLKNRTTIKPTPKSIFFNDFNARRGIATLNSNSMVTDGNYPVRAHKREERSGNIFTPYNAFFYGVKLDLTSSRFYYNVETNKIKFCRQLQLPCALSSPNRRFR